AMPQVVDKTTVTAGYTLVPLDASVVPHWGEIGAGKAFKDAETFAGERCAMLACPKGYGGNWEGDEGVSPGEPWAQEGGKGVSAAGDQFFDPAYTMSKRLGFPMPFALDYCYNAYLGIDLPCAGGADGGAPADDAGGGAVDAAMRPDGAARDGAS